MQTKPFIDYFFNSIIPINKARRTEKTPMTDKRKILLKNIKPNMSFDKPLWLDESYILALEKTKISNDILNHLEYWGYSSIETEASQVIKNTEEGSSYEGSSSSLNNDAIENEGILRMKDFFVKLTIFSKDIFDNISSNSFLNIKMITEKIKEVITVTRDSENYILRLSELKAHGFDALCTHAALTTIISISLSETLGLAHFRQIELGIASILHEIGMVKVPRQLYDKSTELTKNEKKIITRYPLIGAKILRESMKQDSIPLSQDIILGVLQHHERMDGTGYPQGLIGDDISLYAKIIGIASSYAAQLEKRPYRDAKSSHISMLSILQYSARLYDKKIVSALVLNFSLYPIGTYIRLMNGAIGIVIETSKTDLRHPVVKLLIDPDSQAYKENPIVKIGTTDELNIKNVLSIEESENLTARGLFPS